MPPKMPHKSRKGSKSSRLPSKTEIIAQSDSFNNRIVDANRNQIRPDVVPRNLPRMPVWTIARSFDNTSISVSSTTPYSYGFGFTLSQLPGYTDFTSLFDQYRIVQIQAVFHPFQNICNSPSQFPGYLHSVLDYDDSVAPTSPSNLEQYDTYRLQSMLETQTRIYNPSVSREIYLSLSTTGYEMSGQGTNAPWIDSASSTVPWYGLKLITSDTAYTSATTVGRLDFTVVCQFRAAF